MTFFQISEDAKGKTLAIFFDNGDTETIPETHVSFKAIVDKWFNGTVVDSEIRELVQVRETLAKKLVSLSDRVTVDAGGVYFDGDELRGELTDLIKKMFEEGRTLDFKPLVNFLEKASTNPSLKSIDGLYRWVSNRDLVIDPDGDIIAYKGVELHADGKLYSFHSGTAFVNGEEITGKIPNVPGTVISMPRSTVDDGSYGYCSTGLHVGTHGFAKSFAGPRGSMVLVKFNPRDVVAVPEEASSQKMRVCKYVVLAESGDRIETAVYTQTTIDDVLPQEEPKKTVAEPKAPIRDSKGRFIKGGARDSKGRFI
ncbi:Hypothetical Protein OBI_RACECAR_166 [Arthrobacter phage Racecar]|nr:rIIB-like protein [Arthrobacter phage Racecar]QFG12890.1 rIIB-like protein [Arthrobacter phage Mimi]